LLIVPILKLIKTVLSLLDITTTENAFYFYIFSYLNMSMNLILFLNCGE
jgi:hypothetical protein